MIESLLIKNFQAHDKYRVDFDKVTTIVGPSDVGKSSLIRALTWALTNAPNGSAFVKTGESSCSVKVIVDGHSVVRSRAKSINEYKLDGEEYKAFGTAVPEDIAKLLNVLEVNLQGQFDSPFWVSLSAGEVSRRLNEVVDLSMIDKCLSLSKSRVSDQKKRRDIYHESSEKSQQAVEDLMWVEEAAEQYAAIERVSEDCDAVDLDIEDLRKMVVDAQVIENRVEQNKERVRDLCSLGKLTSKVNDKKEDIDAITVMLAAHSRLLLDTEVPVLFEFDASVIDQAQIEIFALEEILERSKRMARTTSRGEEELRTMMAELVEVTGGICPLCGGEFDEEKDPV
jgi:DNA repair exonuclease SbcCD ATPase subunit